MSQGVHGVDARLQYILQNTSLDSTVLSMTDNLYITRTRIENIILRN